MKPSKKIGRTKESGIAMLIALMALLLLSILGMGFMFMADTENSVNSNYRDSQKAYFAAQAGLENVRVLMTQGTTLSTQASLLAMPNNTIGNGIIYVYNPNPNDAFTIDPTSGPNGTELTIAANPTLDDELCHEQFANLLPPIGGMTAGTAGAPCGIGGASEVINGQQATKYFQLPNPVLPVGSILNSNTSSALPFKWVRITNKQNLMGLSGVSVDTTQPKGTQVCWTGLQEIAPSQGSCAQYNAVSLTAQANPVWMLTAMAVTRSGSRRMAQMEVAVTPPISTNATIATSGTIKLTGQVTVNGNDDCTPNNAHMSIYSGECVPGAANCSPSITNQVPPDNLTGNGGQTGVTTYTSTGAVATQGSTGQGAWPFNVDQIINQYKQLAQPATGSPWNYSCNNNTCKVQTEQFGTFPTNPITGQTEDSAPVASDGSPAIVYVPGNLTLNSPKSGGDGLLIVNGDLTVDGGLEYYGLILVKGQIHFTGGGNQGVNLYGAILAGDSASAADAVGGSFSFHYSSCALKQTAPPGPPRLLATHEIMF